ncbi:MAG TPA: preprotein translocase subunit YajC [Virgibacillus sp.]|nr:preprotein translocase subunit YajC [Virgibacillus sp.]
MNAEMLSPIIMIVLMFALFYFFIIRPQQKRQRETRDMQGSLQKGSQVITFGGFHGEVHALDESTVILKSDEGVKLTYDRASVREIQES